MVIGGPDGFEWVENADGVVQDSHGFIPDSQGLIKDVAGQTCRLARAAMSALPEVPLGLPEVPADRESGCPMVVQTVGRGSHEGGKGAVPAALQGVLRNMSTVLTAPFSFDRASL